MKTVMTSISVLALTAACASGSISQEADNECEEAVWTVHVGQNTPTEGEIRQSALSTRYCTLNGTVALDEYRHFDPSGNELFKGVSIVHTPPGSGTERTLWVMVGDDGFTQVNSIREGDMAYGFGGGYDIAGDFHERNTTIFSENDTVYRYIIDKSFDSGRTWQAPYTDFIARQSDQPVPPQPDELNPVLAETIELFDDSDLDWMPILDGDAALAFSENEDGQTLAHYAAEYQGPRRYRVLTWNLLTGFTSQTAVSSFRPDEEWLAFASQRSGNGDIYATNLSSGETVQVIGSEEAEGSPRFDLARDRIVYHRFRDDEVMLMANGEELFEDPNGDVAPSWAQNGQWMTYVVPSESGEYLFLQNVQNPEMRFQLSGGTVVDRYPAFSPRGDRIAFAKNVNGEGWDLYIFNLTTRQLERLTHNATYVGHPSWSPDEQRIAFDMMFDGQTEIAVLDIESGNISRLTNREGNDLIPVWSGDNVTIAFGGDVDGNREIFTANTETGEITQVTDSEGADGGPVFVTASSIGQD